MPGLSGGRARRGFGSYDPGMPGAVPVAHAQTTRAYDAYQRRTVARSGREEVYSDRPESLTCGSRVSIGALASILLCPRRTARVLRVVGRPDFVRSASERAIQWRNPPCVAARSPPS